MSSGREEKQLQSAVQATSYSISLQLIFRIQTFLLNAFILRYISRETLGVINVRLLLLYSTSLFLSREPFRNACTTNPQRQQWTQIINLMWFSVPTSVMCSSVLAYIWAFWLEQPSDSLLSQYHIAVWTIAICTTLEMLAEPLYLVARIHHYNRLRAIIEGASVSVRCVSVAVAVYLFPDYAVLGFAFGQILYSFVWVFAFYVYFICVLHKSSKLEDFPLLSVRDFFPRYTSGQSVVPNSAGALTWSFFKQGFVKQLLTEGERYVMTFFAVLSFGEQGIFDVVNNLGSLAARFLFRPIEENSYQFFASSVKRGELLTQNEQNTVGPILKHLLRTMSLIGFVILVFGFSYSTFLLQIYGGEILTSGSGPLLLRSHCFYVLLLAINGITECYAMASMTNTQVDSYNFVMVTISFLYLISCFFLTRTLGSVGFILANCVNMAARIIYCVKYIRTLYRDCKDSPLSGLKPSNPVLLVLAVGGVAMSVSESYLCCDRSKTATATHVCIGAAIFSITTYVVYTYERELISFVKDKIIKKKTS